MSSDEDKELFRRAMEQTGVVRQRYKSFRAGHNKHRPPVVIPKQRPDNDSVPGSLHQRPLPVPVVAAIDRTENEHAVQFVRAGTDKRQWKRLRKGAMEVEESVDLHGMRSHQASRTLEQFLAECLYYRLECIEIIHGKGLGSDQPGGVLRPLTIHFLKQQPEVIAFCSAPPALGGSGATLVLLKPPG